MTIYSLIVLLSQFATSLLFHDQFKLLLLDLYTDFSGGRSRGLVCLSLEEFSTVYCDSHSHTVYSHFSAVNEVDVDAFLELSCLFSDPTDVGNLISGLSAFSKTGLNIWKFAVHVLLKPGLKNFEHSFARV